MITGYRNPPKSNQFKKGSSGNPMGRPRREQQQVSVGYLFRKVAGGLVPIEVDGGQSQDAALGSLYASDPHNGIEQEY